MDTGVILAIAAIAAVLLAVAVLVLLANKSLLANDTPPNATQTRQQREEAVLGLRDLLYSEERLDEAMEVHRPQYKTLKELDPNTVLGVVVDIGLQGGTATVAGFANGDARLFWNTGGGIIGDMRDYPAIAQAAKVLVETAQPIVTSLPVETTHPLALPQRIRFALLTPGGTHVADEAQDEVQKPSHRLYPLFLAMNDLLTQLRLLDETTKGR